MGVTIKQLLITLTSAIHNVIIKNEYNLGTIYNTDKSSFKKVKLLK